VVIAIFIATEEPIVVNGTHQQLKKIISAMLGD
jgi:hypothetical protein